MGNCEHNYRITIKALYFLFSLILMIPGREIGTYMYNDALYCSALHHTKPHHAAQHHTSPPHHLTILLPSIHKNLYRWKVNTNRNQGRIQEFFDLHSSHQQVAVRRQIASVDCVTNSLVMPTDRAQSWFLDLFSTS